jgi:hypothetical protein
MKKCPKCGNDVQDILDACEECGASLIPLNVKKEEVREELKKKGKK